MPLQLKCFWLFSTLQFLAFFFTCQTSQVWAQAYPQKPIKLILPFPTGGTFLVGQLLSEKLPALIGQPVIIENHPGAGGSIAMELASKALPDGYTLFVTSPTLTITPIVQKKLRFNPLKDLIPVAKVASVANVFVIHAKLPFKTFGEIVEFAKANPGKLTYGTGGPGASNHFATEQFLALTNTQMLHIPYQSATHAITNVVGGQIDLVIGGLPTSAPLVKGGQLRALAVLTQKRNPILPDVPTVVELGFPELVVDTWYGVMAPFGTNPQIIEMLNREITKITKSTEIAERFAKSGTEPLWSTPHEFASFIQSDYAKWLKLSQTNKMKFD